MFLYSWLRKITPPTQPVCRAASRRQFRPAIEGLEDRAVPAVLTVTTALDVMNSSDGVLSLREAVQQADPATPGGDTIVFDSSLNGQTITLHGSELLIYKNLNIQGPGADLLAISGTDSSGVYSRVFDVAANEQVSISGLTIRYGRAFGTVTNGENGGGIFSLGTLAVSDCTFSDNDCGGYGASIASGNGFYAAALTVSGCTFSENYAELGAGIYNANGTATVSHSTFSGNYVFTSGGAIFNAYPAMLTVTDSTFTDNQAWSGSGGGIYNSFGTLTVSSCTFSGNSAVNPFSNDSINHQGGAIFTYYSASISNSTFNNNVATADGGGIYNAGTITVSGCTLSSNAATTGSGGGIYSRGSGGTISSTTLSNNSAHVNGGGLCFTSGTLTLNGCGLTGNSAAQGGGIFSAPVSTIGSLTLTGCTISGNSADVGGGIYNAYAFKATLTIKESMITSNIAATKGGGLYNNGATTIQRTTISNNSAGVQGGGIFNDSNGVLTLYSSSIVSGNLAPDGADIFSLGRITRKKG